MLENELNMKNFDIMKNAMLKAVNEKEQKRQENLIIANAVIKNAIIKKILHSARYNCK